MKRNIVNLAVALFTSAALFSCSKDNLNNPQQDPLIDAIVYMGKWHSGEPAVCVMLPDATKKTTLYAPIEQDNPVDYPRYPSISPNGNHVLINNDVSSAPTESALNIQNLESLQVSPLSQLGGIEAITPIYTPDGQHIVYVNVVDKTIEIVNADGTNATVIYTANAGATVHSPSATSDPKKIVFQQSGSTVSEIYSMNTDGSECMKIKGDDNYSYRNPRVISGDKIIYVKVDKSIGTPANASICTANLDGSEERIVIADGDYYFPSLNSKSNMLLYWNEITGQWVVASIVGSNVSTIRTMSGTKSGGHKFCRIDTKHVSGNPEPSE